MNIRFGKLDDLAEVQRLNQLLFTYELERNLNNNVYNQNWPYQEFGTNYFKSCLKRENDRAIFIAEADGRIVGYLAAGCRQYAYLRQNPMAEIENMFVEEAYRGQGAGSKLVVAFKAWAADLGAAHLKVASLALNARALAFYRKHGFTDFETVLINSGAK